jgi:hypothetical protein
MPQYARFRRSGFSFGLFTILFVSPAHILAIILHHISSRCASSRFSRFDANSGISSGRALSTSDRPCCPPRFNPADDVAVGMLDRPCSSRFKSRVVCCFCLLRWTFSSQPESGRVIVTTCTPACKRPLHFPANQLLHSSQCSCFFRRCVHDRVQRHQPLIRPALGCLLVGLILF